MQAHPVYVALDLDLTFFVAAEGLVLQTIPTDVGPVPSPRRPASLPVRTVLHTLVILRFLNDGRIVIKETNLSYHLEKVFDIDIPALHHENDGLIYTCVSKPYTPGTDRNVYALFPPPTCLSPCRLRLTLQIEMEATERKLGRLQVGLEIPSLRHEPKPTGSVCETYICVICVVGRGGPEGGISTVRRDARH